MFYFRKYSLMPAPITVCVYGTTQVSPCGCSNSRSSNAILMTFLNDVEASRRAETVSAAAVYLLNQVQRLNHRYTHHCSRTFCFLYFDLKQGGSYQMEPAVEETGYN